MRANALRQPSQKQQLPQQERSAMCVYLMNSRIGETTGSVQHISWTRTVIRLMPQLLPFQQTETFKKSHRGSAISEDMDKAKEIFKDTREVRKPLLEAKDVELMKALEAGTSTTAIATAKDARDAPAASAISSASTIAELKAARWQVY